MEINAIGLACPKPVILTKKQLRESPNEIAKVYVDNEIATQNLQKLAKGLGYRFQSTKIQENEYLVELFPQKDSLGGNVSATLQSTEQSAPSNNSKNTNEFIVIFSSDEMGKGESEFSKTLLEGFIYSLTEQDQLPSYILCYNRGVFLSAQNENAIKDLKSLHEKGVEILSCGLCLDQYGLKQNLQVGSITNMYRICELMSQYRNVSPC